LTKDGGITEELMVYTSLNPPKKAHGNFEVIESKSIARLKIFHGRLMSIQEHKLKMPNLLTLFVGFIESYWVLLIILGFIPIILAFYRWISST
jgi:hypothetical protein